MLVCPRGDFVPPAYAVQAYSDVPIRVHENDYNISAPHMHACMLEALDVQPGDRLLDVGCGCGIVAACASLLVGRAGTVAGIDIRQACVRLSCDNVARLRASSAEYASSACDVRFSLNNAFMLDEHRGRYNKVCGAAACSAHERSWHAAQCF